MSLHSLGFIAFVAGLVAVLGIIQLLRQKWGILSRVQLFVILVGSYYFIYLYDKICCACIFAVTIWSYSFGRLIGICREHKNKSRMLLWGGSIGLILFLCYFKYAGFFMGEEAFIILPIGISFYVFSAISYIADVYLDRCDVETDFFVFAVYLSFFPKIIAGPIIRGKDFLPQVKGYAGIKRSGLETGVQIFVFGLFKKMVLADHLGVFVDDVFRMPGAFNTGTVMLGAVSYSLQIYLDFSGYSDMAVGVSRMLGFDMAANFNLPYIAENVSDFWNRWHISLSTWLRDYVYIPLGGSRKGEVRTYLNLMVTMLVSGLWHGVGWTFMLWGLLHGVLSCLHRFADGRIHHTASRVGRLLRILATFVLVTLLWVIFRADDLEIAGRVFKAMFTVHSGINQPYTWTIFAIVVLGVASYSAYRRPADNRISGYYPVLDLSRFWNQVLFFVFCGLTIIMGYFGNTAFIYGKF